MADEIEIEVFDKSLVRQGWIGNPSAFTVTPRHNMMSTGTISMPGDHRMVPAVMAKGSRCVVKLNGDHVISGPIRHRRGYGPLAKSMIVFEIQDDFRLLDRVLGWPAPGIPNPNTPGTFTQATAEYDVQTGPAETVLKGFVARNVARLGLPVVVAQDQGRGVPITVSARMHPLRDRLFPAVDQAGIGVTVQQAESGLVVDCYVPVVRTQVLTEESGIVTDWEWSESPPSVTRVVVGGQGEATARTFRLVRDQATETAWGDVIEQFRDARDATSDAVLDSRGWETIADGGHMYGLKLTLSDVGVWRYNRAFRVGDTVTHEIAPGASVTDVLREARISFGDDTGLTVTPVVGDRSDDPSRDIATVISALTKTTREIQAGR